MVVPAPADVDTVYSIAVAEAVTVQSSLIAPVL